MKCCICNKDFTGYGNNPDLVKQDGRCCDKCNINHVIPSRLSAHDKIKAMVYATGNKWAIEKDLELVNAEET